jgi:16S rRNA (guanine(966)-N(2))-methyltransferase RsmD
MRVVAGNLRSRKLKSVRGTAVRPTPDRLRQALFNVLAPRIQGCIFLDAYAGTGAVGIEALSRGAKRVTLIERNAQALAAISENVRSLGIANQVTVVRGNAAHLVGNYPADIAFLDPPYEQTQAYRESLIALSAAGCQLAIAQHASRFALEDVYGGLRRTRTLKQGDNSLSFYEPVHQSSTGEH